MNEWWCNALFRKKNNTQKGETRVYSPSSIYIWLPKYSLNRWLSHKVHHWATILRFLSIWFLQYIWLLVKRSFLFMYMCFICGGTSVREGYNKLFCLGRWQIPQIKILKECLVFLYSFVNLALKLGSFKEEGKSDDARWEVLARKFALLGILDIRSIQRQKKAPFQVV